MNEITFLTVDYLKDITPITSALANQTDLLLPFVSIGESMHLYNSLGLALKDDLLAKVENNTLNTDEQELVEGYIVPASAWFAMFEASIFIIFKAEAKGITKKNSDNSTALDRQELAIYRQSILDKANFYKSRLITYLETNKDKFPLYRAECGVNKTSYGGGIFLF